ncbi:sodium-dependent proline transporter-like isoform X1 [Gopherus flavomarginatus]|uniref:sodium-dependent proline transporter-like isoform X1 n=2 Tax=Gopherus flavomarginatus TaxID=286002 RepID=UPI0021CC18BA|nr:sodium-dependent proline transporter-like isoform X1 [Gopherus flavomarginatus]XP_050779242.1 sodium-dependent proline transporter-like isoform X1 [Gopherus flavomarginatus]XP_050780061.1 sodium-dependent proline transporter-like isoform X1 [Gopherus flavomarginatus]XP_050780822.1 sodium-dependent proline transporter-like isoform X1 [Gopherus flavomarginatus]XP_050781600.1 sodium-dependent proline transporter-like isoform X1 [Gopherus flavomarginatus]XP_050782387.1 sodium-dependent proline 
MKWTLSASQDFAPLKKSCKQQHPDTELSEIPAELLKCRGRVKESEKEKQQIIGGCNQTCSAVTSAFPLPPMLCSLDQSCPALFSSSNIWIAGCSRFCLCWLLSFTCSLGMKLFPEQWSAEGVRQSDFQEQEMPATVMPGSPIQLNSVTLESEHPQSVSQPQAAFQIEPVTPDPALSQSRETWGGKYEFLLSCIGYCVGLGNVWRFPYLCYRNGGGVFLIPYFIMLLFTGLPLFLLELSLGQYGAAGPITVWKCCPLLKGIGVGMLLVSSLVSLYYNVIIAWTFYYLGMSFQSPLPWSCNAPQNAPLCQNASGNASRFSASEAFWNEQVLGVTHSSGLHDPGPVRWPLAICLLVAWIVIFLCMLKGIRSSGKVVYFTATFPYLVLIVLIIRGATLEGSIEGVRFYLSSDWSRLQSAQVWNDAASQIFYSLGIGFGGLLSMASYNKFDNNVIRDTLVIAIGNCCTSFFAGFAIFSILGHMAWRKRVPVGEVADSGPGLAFVAYPEALALLPASAFWSVLFFLMMFTLGVDTLFGNMEGITTAVLDEFPALREWRRKTLFLGALCFIFYLLGLLLITEGGIYWFTLIDAYSTSFGLIIITLFMCIGIAFFYGVNQFCRDIVDMICRCPPWCSKLLLYFKACWVFITPCLLLFILIYIFLEMYNTSLHYGAYAYPRWGKALGVCMGTMTCIQIPLWALVAICRESGTLTDRFRKAIHPLNSWRTATTHAEVIDVPYTINLVDSDFASPPQGSSEA